VRILLCCRFIFIWLLWLACFIRGFWFRWTFLVAAAVRRVFGLTLWLVSSRCRLLLWVRGRLIAELFTGEGFIMRSRVVGVFLCYGNSLRLLICLPCSCDSSFMQPLERMFIGLFIPFRSIHPSLNQILKYQVYINILLFNSLLLYKNSYLLLNSWKLKKN